MTPQRIQLRRTKGWRMPPNTVKVDRSPPNRWGNRYSVVYEHGFWRVRGPDVSGSWLTCTSRDAALRLAVSLFRDLQAPRMDFTPLRGLNLACWCPLDGPCHADVEIELANEARP